MSADIIFINEPYFSPHLYLSFLPEKIDNNACFPRRFKKVKFLQFRKYPIAFKRQIGYF